MVISAGLHWQFSSYLDKPPSLVGNACLRIYINKMEDLTMSLKWLSSYVPYFNQSVRSVSKSCDAPLLRSPIIRVAGLSGALAVSLGAYGAHVVHNNPEISETRKRSFETASRYHLIHTTALLGSPLARYPLLTGSLLLGGIIIFCGPCYHYSLTGEETIKRFTPFGGILLIAGWASFIL